MNSKLINDGINKIIDNVKKHEEYSNTYCFSWLQMMWTALAQRMHVLHLFDRIRHYMFIKCLKKRVINKSMEWHWRQSSLNNNHSPKKSVSDADLLTNSRPFFSVIADHPPVLFNYYFSGMCLCQNMFFFFFFLWI